MRKFGKKLIVRLLIAIAISYLVAFGVLILVILSISYLYKINYLTDVSQGNANFRILIQFTAAILTFIAVFLLLVRKKILYLKHITESVHHIANGNLGLTIRTESRDELTQLAQHINYMSEELENKFEHERQLERVKSELISSVSHDLRTPLTSIIGYLDLLKKEQYNSKAQFQEYLETIYSKSQRLKYLIDELFEYTHLSSPDVTLNRSKTDLSALLEQITGEYIPCLKRND